VLVIAGFSCKKVHAEKYCEEKNNASGNEAEHFIGYSTVNKDHFLRTLRLTKKTITIASEINPQNSKPVISMKVKWYIYFSGADFKRALQKIFKGSFLRHKIRVATCRIPKQPSLLADLV
jgi:hypothetical protein